MPRRKKEATATSAPHSQRFRLVSKEVEAGLFEVRLMEEAARGEMSESGPVEAVADAGAVADVEVVVERLTCISREFIESMGGEAPCDCFEARWPLESSASQTLCLVLGCAQDEAEEKRGADSLPFPLPTPIRWEEVDLAGQTTTKLASGAEHSAITTFHVCQGGMSCQIGLINFNFRDLQFGFLRKPGVSEEQSFTFEACGIEAFHAALDARNAALGLTPPESLPKAQVRLERRQPQRSDRAPLQGVAGDSVWSALAHRGQAQRALLR